MGRVSYVVSFYVICTWAFTPILRDADYCGMLVCVPIFSVNRQTCEALRGRLESFRPFQFGNLAPSDLLHSGVRS